MEISGAGGGGRQEDRLAPGREPSSPHPGARRFFESCLNDAYFLIFHTLKKLLTLC